MTVNIAGMGMPKSCWDCQFIKRVYQSDDGWVDFACHITARTVNSYCRNSKSYKNKRHPKCPLQEVKE